jgi:hypothetical protein
VEAEVDELEALSTARLREKCKELGAGSVGDKRKAEVLRRGIRAARGAVQHAVVAAAAAVAAADAPAAGATVPLQLRRQKLAPGVCGSLPQATAGRRHQWQWHGGGWRTGRRTRQRTKQLCWRTTSQ